MTDLIALLQPRITDRDNLLEFIEDLEDQIPGIERDVAALRRDPSDRALIARLFRSLHTIKGDAAICKVEVGVLICHPMESLLARCRDGDILFNNLIAETILLALDRLELTVDALRSGRDVAHLNLPQLVGGMEGMATATPDELAARAATTIEAVTGFKPLYSNVEVPPAKPAEATTTLAHAEPFASQPLQGNGQADDLRFFRELAMQFESRSPLFKGRTDRILRLALDTNAAAGNPVDVAQLEAAVCMHDVGMMFAPESVWLKVDKLSDDDKRQLQEHPLHGAGLLSRMTRWGAAAEMVRQHHEMPNGAGYPARLTDSVISTGAKILAIVDAFEAVTLKHSHRGQTRSLVRAIAEINACDNQFAAELIAPFNSVIRKMVEA